MDGRHKFDIMTVRQCTEEAASPRAEDFAQFGRQPNRQAVEGQVEEVRHSSSHFGSSLALWNATETWSSSNDDGIGHPSSGT